MRAAPLLALGLAGLLPTAGPAHTEEPDWQYFSCLFDTECIDTEPCAGTHFALDFRQVARQDPGPGRISFDPMTPPGLTEVTTEAMDFTAFASPTPGTAIVNWLHVNEAGAMHLFSLTGGRARYSLHLPGAGTALYYEGTCERQAS